MEYDVFEKRIYVDFLKADGQRRLILSCHGTTQDLYRFGIELQRGLKLTFYSEDSDEFGNPDDLVVEGVVQFDEEFNRWVAEIDWAEIKHLSDFKS